MANLLRDLYNAPWQGLLKDVSTLRPTSMHYLRSSQSHCPYLPTRVKLQRVPLNHKCNLAAVGNNLTTACLTSLLRLRI